MSNNTSGSKAGSFGAWGFVMLGVWALNWLPGLLTTPPWEDRGFAIPAIGLPILAALLFIIYFALPKRTEDSRKDPTDDEAEFDPAEMLAELRQKRRDEARAAGINPDGTDEDATYSLLNPAGSYKRLLAEQPELAPRLIKAWDPATTDDELQRLQRDDPSPDVRKAAATSIMLRRYN